MRYLFTILFVLLIGVSSSNAFIVKLYTPSAGPDIPDPGGDCPSGIYQVGYNGSYPGEVLQFCYDSGATNATSVMRGDPQVTVTEDYVEYIGTNKGLDFDVDGTITPDIDSLGTVFFSYRQGNDNGGFGDTVQFELNYSSSEQLFCQVIGTSSYIRCFHEGGAANAKIDSNTVTFDTDYRCGYSWDAANDAHALDCVETGSVTWATANIDNETIEPFDDGVDPVDPTEFLIGEQESGKSVDNTTRVWDVFLADGYQAADPGSL